MSPPGRGGSSPSICARRYYCVRNFQMLHHPVVSAAMQEIVSFQALLRWNHPVRGV
jgi:EAL domain-containing protein (putative c-di-GMP-specific phosphodiesterase class I)